MEWVSEKHCQAEAQLGVGAKARVGEPSRLQGLRSSPNPPPTTPHKNKEECRAGEMTPEEKDNRNLELRHRIPGFLI